MTATLSFDLTTSWTQVSTGSRDVVIQLQGAGAAMVHVGTGAPATDAAGIGISPDSREFGAANLPATDNVYARAVSGTARIAVIRS